MRERMISVITPTLNAAAYLQACLDNVRGQAYAPVEHLVVDGGSRDGTREMVLACAGARLVDAPGLNQSAAINLGFRLAKGEIVAWLNADDLYTPGALAAVAEAFGGDATLDAAYGDCDVVDLADRLLWRERPGPYDFERLLRRGNYLAQPAVFLRKRVLDEVGYLDERFECGMDYDLWLRLRGRHVAYLPRVLAVYRWYATSKTAVNQFGCWRELLVIVRRYGGGWTPALAWSYARMLLALGRQQTVRRIPRLGTPRD